MKYVIGLLAGAGILLGVWFLWPAEEQYSFAHKSDVTLVDGQGSFWYRESQAKTVGEFLDEQKIDLSPDDAIFPTRETALSSGSTLLVTRQKQVEVVIGDERTVYQTTALTVGAVLEEFAITLDEDDLIDPIPETTFGDKSQIQITRVVVTEEKEETKIPFISTEEEDDTLSWRKKEVVQKGEPGILETTVRIARHDGKEVSRKVLSKTVIKEQVTEKVRQGTLVKVGKSHTGGASWYAHTGTLSAANPWLPMGSYVRVTNTANGKSVIVKINDRGPFGGGRIIDLDKVAFQEIASLGQGVAQVKMEEITN